MMRFNEIKNAVSVPEAARYYGIEVKGSNMCRCPFHNDRRPSMKLYPDHYHCFGCSVHGDVIDLVGRLFGLTAMQAAGKICADFGLEISSDQNLPPPEKKKRIAAANEVLRSEKIHRAFYMALRELRQLLIICKEKLDGWKYHLRPASMDLDPGEWDSRFVTAHIWSDYVDYLIDVLDFGESYERFDLFVHRKEVQELAGRLIDSGPAGCGKTGTVS